VALGEDIVINFVNCNPENDDWIGVYPDWTDTQDLGYAQLWAWSCGDQDCRGKTTSGTITFNGRFVGEPNLDAWPLDQDDYKVYLIRRNPGGPYSGYVESDKFKVKRNSC
jgi:hypothetical protein